MAPFIPSPNSGTKGLGKENFEADASLSVEFLVSSNPDKTALENLPPWLILRMALTTLFSTSSLIGKVIMKFFVASCVLFLVSSLSLSADNESIETLQSQYNEERLKIEAGFLEKRETLNANYLAALKKAEAELQKQGNLDGLLAAKQYRETFEKANIIDGAPESIAHLVEIYKSSIAPMEKERDDLQVALDAKYAEAAKRLMTELTKLGQLEEAVKAQALVETFKSGSPKPTMASTPPNSAPGSSKPADQRLEPIPDFTPPVWQEKSPFDNMEWPEKLTLPPGNYRLKGERKLSAGQELLISEGSTFRGSDDRNVWFFARRQVVARGAEFSDIHLRGDLSSRFFFTDCKFNDVTFEKGGGWFAGGFMSRWQLVDCQIFGSFINSWKPKHTGVQMYRCLVERVEFPSLTYEEKDEPSDIASQSWAMILNSHFRKCEIPQSVLTYMEDCTFEDCRFVEDETPLPDFEKPIKRTLYIDGGSWLIQSTPKNLFLEQKPIQEAPK